MWKELSRLLQTHLWHWKGGRSVHKAEGAPRSRLGEPAGDCIVHGHFRGPQAGAGPGAFPSPFLLFLPSLQTQTLGSLTQTPGLSQPL